VRRQSLTEPAACDCGETCVQAGGDTPCSGELVVIETGWEDGDHGWIHVCEGHGGNEML
jgi:hypothetical protein